MMRQCWVPQLGRAGKLNLEQKTESCPRSFRSANLRCRCRQGKLPSWILARLPSEWRLRRSTRAAKFEFWKISSQAVSLGRDSFVTGKIDRETIEDCVHVLSIYRQKLNEYAIDSNDQIRVVATSAVREASNELAFRDRVFIATGFEIESFDVAELHRVTYLGILPFLEQLRSSTEYSNAAQNVVCEIGGGSTEVLILDDLDVLYSHTFRFGALRIRRTVEALNIPLEKMRDLLKSQVRNVATDIGDGLDPKRRTQLIAMGSEMRWIATEVLDQNPGS